MLQPEQVARFQERGFLNGGQLLDKEEVDLLRADLDRVIAEKDNPGVVQPVLLRNLNPNPETPVWQIVNIWEASEPFRSLIQNRRIAAEIVQLTGANGLRIWHDQIQYKPAETGGVNMWHQDAPLWPILAPMTEVSAWVALDDVDEGNGCMSMVPGSHRWGNQMEFIRTLENYEAMPSTWNGNRVEIVRCPVKKGEVHYHHALTWHGSHANTSNRPRRAIAIHYMTQETHFVASGQHVMKQFVDLEDGAPMQGEHFPEVWP
ncbi:MAG: phytanoyl-CoA dioxygenase family protein [bacterium]|nr:phytanoyl-CoA dioxygenase family protein [bacterium]